MSKIALITGASSGIGEQLARIHAARGGDLFLVARNEIRLNELKKELESQHGIVVNVYAKDLTLATAAQEVYDELKKLNIEIDYLINNAGFGGIGKFHERNLTEDISMINLNISALVSLTHLFLKDFVACNSGKILNVSSTASLMAGPLQAVYFASKAFVTSFSNALAEELHDTNISVTNLMPGATDTKFAKVSGMDNTKMFDSSVSAKSVAQDGYDAMLKSKLDVVSGLTFAQRIMTAMIPFSPKKITLTQIRKMQEVKP
ncbi:MAG: short-chain dehydrogenase [Bacteroidetes bacterium 4572_112]|nr:MAG: short-chain dehydrogenase [Bacteroidetes bacterium 4572_112]